MNTRTILTFVLGSLAIFTAAFTGSILHTQQALAQNTTIQPLDQWKSDGTNITQRTASKPVKLTGLESQNCLGTSATGVLQAGSCSGGGGSGVGTVATSSLETKGGLPYWTTTSGYPAKLGSVATSTLTATGPLSLSGAAVIIAAGSRSLSIADAAADGSTKGAASFTANDFDASSGNISIDYTNGAAASGAAKGFLTSADWTTFNNKQAAGTYVTAITVASSNGFAGSSSGGATPALTLSTSVTGLLKGNGTAISAAANGTDYTLLTAVSCSAGNHVSAITAAGVSTCTADSGGSGSNYWTNSGITSTLNTGSVAAAGNFTGTSTATSTFLGPVGIGTTSPSSSFLTVTNTNGTAAAPPSGSLTHMIYSGALNGRLVLDTYNATALGSNFQGRHARGTAASPTATQADDTLTLLGGDGYGTTAYHSSSVGAFAVRAESNFTDASAPTYASIYTTPSASVTTLERLRITSAGRVGIGTTTPLAFLDVQTDGSVMPFRATNSSGSSLLEIENSGNTGLASSTPWGQLSVNPTAANGAAPSFVVGSSTATNFIIDNAGRVGIGTGAPTNTLSVTGTANITGASTLGGALTYGGVTLSNAVTGTGNMVLSASPTFTGTIAAQTASFTNLTASTQLRGGTSNTAALVVIGTTAASPTVGTAGIIFKGLASGTTEVARMDAFNGNWGFASSSPQAQFAINPTAVNGTFPSFLIGSSTGTILTVNNNGNVGIATTTPGWKFAVAGTVGITGQVNLSGQAASGVGDVYMCLATNGDIHSGATCAASTRAVKDNIQNLTLGGKTLDLLNPVSFNYKPGYYGGKHDIGLIADDTFLVDPRFTIQDAENKPIAINWPAITAVLVKTVQEQGDQLDQIKRFGIATRNAAEENGQWLAIVALFALVVVQGYKIRKLTA